MFFVCFKPPEQMQKRAPSLLTLRVRRMLEGICGGYAYLCSWSGTGLLKYPGSSITIACF